MEEETPQVIPDFDDVIERIVENWKEKQAKGENASHMLDKLIDIAEIKQAQSVQRMSIQQHRKHGYDDISEESEEELEFPEETGTPRETLMKVLNVVPISSIFVRRKITVLDSKDSPERALEKLARRGILSAPVVKHHKDKPNIVLGMLDVLGIMKWMLTILQGKKKQSLEKLFEEEKVGNLTDFMAEWSPVYQSTTLFELFSIFAKGVHRVPVVSEEGKFEGVISQTNAVRFFHKHAQLIAPFTDIEVQNVEEYKKRKDIRAVGKTVPTFISFHTMTKWNLSAVAVVDEADHLVGGLSATYVRGLNAGNLHLLMKPTEKFIDMVRPETKAYKVSCAPTLPLHSAIGILASRKEHRIWIVSADGKLEGMLTLTDIIKYVIS